jgi:hypothetical protein
MFSLPLACTSFPSSMPTIHSFGLLIVSQMSCILNLYWFYSFSFFFSWLL